MKGRLRVEATGGPADVRFLNVLQGADAQVPPSPVTMVESASGTGFAGVEVEGTLVLFKADLQSEFAGVSFLKPGTAARILITGLAPGAAYAVTETGNSVTVAPNGPKNADQGGVLVLGTATTPPDGGSGPPQGTWQPLTAAKKDLEKLQSEINATQAKTKQDIAQSQRVLTEAGAKQAQVAAQIAPLQKLLADLEANSLAIKKLRASAANTLSAAEQSHRTVLEQITSALPSDRRKAIQDAVEGIDKAIASLATRVEELRAKAATAEAEVADLQKRAAEGTLRDSIARLLARPSQLQAAQREVGRLAGLAAAAAAQKRMGEALYLAGELKRTMETLRKLSAEGEINDVQQVVTRWQDVHAAKAELAAKARALDIARRDLTDAERELERRRKQRDRDIRGEIADLDKAASEAERKGEPVR